MYSPHSCNCSSQYCKIKLMENALQDPPQNKSKLDIYVMIELKFFIMALLFQK